jgi:hypothetical protein
VTKRRCSPSVGPAISILKNKNEDWCGRVS